MIYRGQRDHRWPLSSTLSRERHRVYGKDGIPEEDRDTLLKEFKLAMRGRGPDLNLLNENEVWAFGQHNGLHTPLLDWTKSPFVALYFAFLEPDDPKDNPSRVIFRLNLSRLGGLIKDLLFEPETNQNARLVNQAGLFTLTPPDPDNLADYIIRELRRWEPIASDVLEDASTAEGETGFSSDGTWVSGYVSKIHIPNCDREECLAMLRQMNIHHGSLFPDAFGAAHYSNDWFFRKITENKRDAELVERAASRSKSLVEPIMKKMESGANLPDLLKIDIREFFNEDPTPDVTVEDWVKKLIEHYEKNATANWPINRIDRAGLHNRMWKKFNLLWETYYSEKPLKWLDFTENILAIFEADYRVKHDLPFPDKKTEK